MIRIDPTVRDELVAHCEVALPNEACGYLVGDAETGRVDRFVPLRNEAESPARFRFDPHEQLAVERVLDDEGVTVIGVAHSHPTGENVPSAVDVADAAQFDPLGVWIHVVVAPTPGSVRAFRIRDGSVAEVSVSD